MCLVVSTNVRTLSSGCVYRLLCPIKKWRSTVTSFDNGSHETGNRGELRGESWRGTGDKGREAHRLMKRVSFVRRAFDDKEYFSCGFIFVAFYRRFNEQKGEFVRQHFFPYLSFLYRPSRESENVNRLVNSRRHNV